MELATADLRKQLDELKAKPATPAVEAKPEPPPVRRVEAPVRSTESQQEEYERIMALPNAPTLEKFTAAGKTYEQFLDARNWFLMEARDTERSQRSEREHVERSRVDTERARAGKFKAAFESDPDAQKLVAQMAQTYGLQTFYQLEIDNRALRAAGQPEKPATAYHAIAEEFMNSDHQVALARHLSQPGEMARLAALPDARALIREITRIERDLTTPKPIKTKTTVGEPAEILTATRATDPSDPPTTMDCSPIRKPMVLSDTPAGISVTVSASSGASKLRVL